MDVQVVRVRAKFRCTYLDVKQGIVHLTPVYSGSPENEQFFRYTPGGMIMLQVVNEVALLAYELGKEYYVDFTPAPSE